MLISHRKRFVFVHVHKAAGTSVTRLLLPYARLVDRAVYSRGRLKRAIKLFNRLIGLEHNGHRHLTGHHKFASAAEIRTKMGAERYDSYFSFAFVRNPFDWCVSIHAHLRRLAGHPFHERATALPFDDFLAWSIEEGAKRQSEFVTDETGRVAVDFVGRVEDMDVDLRAVCERLKLPFANAPRENVTPGRERDWRVYYDDASRALVETHFAEDLARFGYSFEGAEPRDAHSM